VHEHYKRAYIDTALSVALRCVALRCVSASSWLASTFFTFLTWRDCFPFCRVAIFTFTYDDEWAYDMKLGGLFLLRCFCFIEGEGV
jgi:hypothetical protein